ncbi:hypothetical protein, partial [Flavobacterium sp.]|uniref:hypothetical protein n=1 Tax=Flavobacterium sp. TaxID=239 RepID=UPI0037C115AA
AINAINTKYNSPSTKKNPQVFSKKSLIELIRAWNKYKDDKIKYKESETMKALAEKLNNKIKPICDDKQYWCWPGALAKIAKDDKTKEIIKMIADYELRPEMPIEWSKNPIEWLSNYDIEAVMRQYSIEKKYKYAFLGVFPIDFSEEDKFGRCLYSHICSLNVKKYVNKGVKYLGLITNLDKHNESGSHWTSTFIIIDPKNKSYGAHYYDSTARQIPSYVKKFMRTVMTQCNQLYPKHNFRITYNNIQHQKKNTECGMFSMVYQIRWLNLNVHHKKLKLNSPLVDERAADKVLNDSKITDDVMIRNRKFLFRPNFQDYISKRQIKL